MYIIPDDFDKLASSVVITHKNTNYRIFMTNDQLTCFTYHQKNHASTRYSLNESIKINNKAKLKVDDNAKTINQIVQSDNNQDKTYINKEHTNINISDIANDNNHITPISQPSQAYGTQDNTQID